MGTFPEVKNNISKGMLILDSLYGVKFAVKGIMLQDGPARYQLVGRVMAYQGNDV